MGDFATMRIEGLKLDYDAIGKALMSDEVAEALNAKGERVAASMNSEDRGEFRSFPSERGNRRRNFVVTYDRHAKATANVDPGIFNRHVREA